MTHELPADDHARATMQQLLGAATQLARGLSEGERETRIELLDTLALAQINVMRLSEGGDADAAL